MTQPVALRWALTAVLTAGGGYCLLRCVLPTARASGHRKAHWVSDFAHIAMSTSMIAMLWTLVRSDRWGIQLAVFTAATGWFLGRALDADYGSGRASQRREARLGLLHQAVAMAAMFWMILTMSVFPAAVPPARKMPGMMMVGTTAPGPTSPAATVITLALAGYLALAALWWLGRSARAAPLAKNLGATMPMAGHGSRATWMIFGPTGEATCQGLMAAAMSTMLFSSL